MFYTHQMRQFYFKDTNVKNSKEDFGDFLSQYLGLKVYCLECNGIVHTKFCFFLKFKEPANFLQISQVSVLGSCI